MAAEELRPAPGSTGAERRDTVKMEEVRMIEILPESDGKLLVLRAKSKLTHKDYEEILIPKLESVINEYEKADIVFDLGEDFHGWEAQAMWDDAKFGLKHKDDFHKVAMVGGPGWAQWIARLSEHFMSAKINTFPSGKFDEALDWAKN